jgi:hypothetical protein
VSGRQLETSLAKPPADKRPLGMEPSYPPQRAGLLPQYQHRGGYGYGADVFSNVGGDYGQARGYNQVCTQCGGTILQFVWDIFCVA